MTNRNNYAIQANQAKQHFLTYNQTALIQKLGLLFDENFLYVNLLCQPIRIDRTTAHMERQVNGSWVDANRYEEVMTLLDLVCDSREDRTVAGRWMNMASFGLRFHQNMLETQDARAQWIQADPERFRRACSALGGIPEPGGDISYRFKFFEDLPVCIQFWFGDEEFFPRIRFLWDENALQYLRYETMHFAIGLLFSWLREQAK